MQLEEPINNWREWFESHGPALVLFARQYTACLSDAEDAVQSGFVRFWPKRRSVRDSRAYLYSAVRTAAIDRQRAKARRTRRETLVGQPDDTGWFQCPVERAELADAIEAALSTLPLEQREVVVLKIWSGLTFKQISKALGISANTAASRYRYGLEALRSQLPGEDRS